MSKKPAVDFVSAMQTFEDREGVQRHAKPTLIKAEPEAEAVSTNGKPAQKSRIGKVSIGLWVDPAVRKQLARLAIDVDKDQSELLAEGLNLVFERYGKPPIAKVG